LRRFTAGLRSRIVSQPASCSCVENVRRDGIDGDPGSILLAVEKIEVESKAPRKVQADGKHLHGAALTSFVKKCCSDQAAAQKLHGAAATSFTKKCVSDATGA
jgi:hypothetical protein